MAIYWDETMDDYVDEHGDLVQPAPDDAEPEYRQVRIRSHLHTTDADGPPVYTPGDADPTDYRIITWKSRYGVQ